MLCLSNILARSGLMKQSSSTTMTSYWGEGTGGFLVAGSSLSLSLLFCAGSKRWRSLMLGPVSGTMKDLNGRDEEQAGRENSGP